MTQTLSHTPENAGLPYANAIGLLQNWLSVSESQICVLEVLRAQLPEVQELLETNFADISENFLTLASNIDTFQALTLPKEDSPSAIDTLDEIESLLNSPDQAREKILFLKEQEQKKLADATRATDIAKEIKSAISGIIVGMQFQDRASQNLVITINVVSEIVTYLQTEIDQTIANLDKAHEPVTLDKEFARRLMSLLKLGELQQKFIQHLLSHQYIETAEEIGMQPGSSTADHNEDDDGIDLF